MRLVLASASPRRAEILRAAGFDFDVVPAGLEEGIAPGEPADAYVRRVASDKSAFVAARHPGRVVLAADTEVVVGGEVLGKPADAEAAARMLRRLSNRTHTVMTGVSIRLDGREVSALDRASVAVGDLSEDDIAWYVSTGEPFDKAGGYAIQGLASRFCRLADGDLDTVIGLPMASVRRLLARVSRGRSGAGPEN